MHRSLRTDFRAMRFPGRRSAVLYSDPVIRWVKREGRYLQPGQQLTLFVP